MSLNSFEIKFILIKYQDFFLFVFNLIVDVINDKTTATTRQEKGRETHF